MSEANKGKNPIECLFDEKNTDPITLYNEKGEEINFEQIALIPKNKNTYAILKPMMEIEGIADDEALVFEVSEPEENSDEYLKLITDVDVIDEVFAIYDKLIDEEEAKEAKAEAKKDKKGKK